MEELVDNGQVCLAWTTNDLILDKIFKHLNLTDLKHARLTCKKFAIVGSRALLRNSVIRLSEFIPFIPVLRPILGPLDKMKLPHWRSHLLNPHGHLLRIEQDLWETKSDLRPREYFRISAYRDYLEGIAVFATDFIPKNVIIYDFNDLVKLPMPHFASIEELQVVFFKPSEGYSFLNEFHKLLPNLRCLELRYIQPEETPFSHRLHSMLRGIQELNQNQPIRLEQLSFVLPADFANSDWSFLAKFKKLKVAKVRWAGGYHDRWIHFLNVQPMEMHKTYYNSNLFGQWLLATTAHLQFSSLNEASLRFDLSPENIENVQMILAGMDLKKLSLETFGEGPELLQLLEGLSNGTIASLTNLLTCSDLYVENWIEEILQRLRDKGFFEESQRSWSVTFRAKTEDGWVRLIKEEARFTAQVQNIHHEFYFDSMEHLWNRHPNIFKKFSYGYCRINYFSDDDPTLVLTRNKCEAISTRAFAGETFVTRFQTKNGQLWATRQEPLKFLCDNDDFRREACISLWNHPLPNWGDSVSLSSWSFFHVPASVMSKWCAAIDTSAPINNAAGL